MMRSFTAVVFAWVLLSNGQALGTSWNTVVLRHDFDTSVGGTPDPGVWIINHPGHSDWVQGRTHFPDPLSTSGPFPRVENRVCIIEHHHYNPYNPGVTFLGGEIRTAMEFQPNRPYRFEARVKSPPHPNGLVSSFFLYGHDGSASDEIDFEFVSNKTNDDVTYPNGDPVLTNPWNESQQCPEYVAPGGLDLTDSNTFRIYWYPSLGRVEWTWVDPVNGETLLRSEQASPCSPGEPMALYFNFWASTDAWPDAYDAGLQPVDDPGANQVNTYEIDYVEVRTSNPAPAPALTGCGNVGLALSLLTAGWLLWIATRQPFRVRGA